MQLYKIRDFSGFFSDTIEFIKQNGVHFFKHFIAINGFLILVLGALTYVFTSFFLQDFMTGFSAENGGEKLDAILNNNLPLFIGLFLAIIACWLLFMLISYSFTPLYFKLYEKHNGTNFTSKDLINSYKQNLSKLIIYVLLSILIGIPLAIAFGLVGFIIAITVIGLLTIPLLVGLYAGIYNMTLLEYLDNKRDYFESFSYAWTLIKSQFWPAVGCMGIFYFINYVVQMALSLIQTGFNLTSHLTIPNIENVDVESNLIFIVITLIIFIITFLVNILLNAIIQINQSIVYYGLKEHNENINTKSDIDLIGENDY